MKKLVIIKSGYNRKKCGVLYVSIAIIAVSLLACMFSILSELTLDHHNAVTDVYAQPYVEKVNHRNLTIDLGNGLKTNAQLTMPAVGEGPFPGVIIFPGAGAGSVFPSTSPYSHMAEYLSERGYDVLRYYKRGGGISEGSIKRPYLSDFGWWELNSTSS